MVGQVKILDHGDGAREVDECQVDIGTLNLTFATIPNVN